MADARVDEAASTSVKSVSFGVLTPEEVRKISVKRITKSDLLDVNDRPVVDGLYDPALGPVYGSDLCKTCGLYSVRCPGHCGHIDFALPVYNPLLFKTLVGIIQNTCFFCHNFRLKKKKVRLYAEQVELILKGDVVKATDLELASLNSIFDESEEKYGSNFSEGTSDSKEPGHHTWTSLQFSKANFVLSRFMRERIKRCKNCDKRNPKVTSPTFGWLKMEMNDSDIRKNILKDSNHSDLDVQFIKQKNSFTGELVPSKVRDMLQRLWENESQFCSLIFNIRSECAGLSPSEKGYGMFLMEALLVPPSKFRPPSKGNQQGDLLEHPQNILLIKVQENNINMMNSLSGGSAHADVAKRWMELQKSVNLLFDNTKGTSKADRENNGIRQLLEKKSGIFRQKMMGKRVNFACRSVISPDPYLAVNEIGIPPHFALRLTYPERVTPWNVDKLRHAIINGADIHPGAINFKDKDQMYKLLSGRVTRMSIARKLPTSRGARLGSGKGPESDLDGKIVSRHIRDGDVVLVNRQPTLHKPSMMAHIVRVLKGEKTLRMHYANCSTYNADFDGDEMNVHLPQDEISRSEALNIANANKQYVVPTSGDPIRGLIQDHIISAVLLTKKDTFLTREEYDQLLYASIVPPVDSSAFLHGRSRVSLSTSEFDLQRPPPSIWKPVPLWTGKQVISAMLNHLTKGRAPFSVANTVKIPKEYLGKEKPEYEFLVRKNEFMHGVLDKNQFVKYGLVHTVQELYGSDCAGTLLSGFSRLFTVFLQIHGFTCGIDDLLIHPGLDMERERILEKCEKRGKEVHYRFISSDDHHKDPLELQLEIEKVVRSDSESATARLDRMMSNSLNQMTSELNKLLFPGGLRKNFPENCLTLMTTTGAKGGMVNFTQISSLLGQQELEGKRVPRMVSGKTLPCFPPWDTASRAGGFIGDRFLTGLRPQEYYFHCMAGRDGLVDTAIKTSRSGYLQRCLIKNLESLKVSYDHTVRDSDGTVVQFLYGEDGVDVHQTSYLRQFEALATNASVIREGRLASTESSAYVTGLPDRLEQEAMTFFQKLTDEQRRTLNLKKKSDLMKLVKLKYMSSLVQPGEPVGVLAAQSVGEPSTQMTLNTFHFAGRGEMNVTLGIPRLQEILMTAKEHIRTPVMTCPLHSFMTRDEADELAAKLRRITVADLLERMEVSVLPLCVMDSQVGTLYMLTGRLYSPEKFPRHFGVTQEACEAALKFDFIDALELSIKRHLDMVSKIASIHSVQVSKLADGAAEEDRDDDDGDGDDAESSAGKQFAGDHDDGGNDDDHAEDHGSDAQKRKMQEMDEFDYEDDVAGEKDPVDGQESGLESEVDQAEDDDDYSLGGQVAAAEEKQADEEDDAHEGTESVATPAKEAKITPMKIESSRSRRSKKPTDRAFFVDVNGINFEIHFFFKDEPHILLAEVAQKAAMNVHVKQSGRIEQCSVVDDKVNGGIALETAGVNFMSFWLLDEFLDINRIRSNDIHAVLRTYGVEAARAAIINEVKNVFNYYKISVDLRHLSLIADFMTVDGGYRPMNRIGAACFGTSPFGKMTFETATKFIVEAALHGDVDTLESPSASVCLGQPMKMGTGSFDLLHNLCL